MKPARFELVVSATAAILLSFAGYSLWRTGSQEPEWSSWQRAWSTLTDEAGAPKIRETTVAWRCAPGDGGACNPSSETERCTTCHLGSTDPRGTADAPRVLREHPNRGTLIDHHAELGCVACHGGDGLALERAPAHEGLATLENAAVPTVEARCALCHDDMRPGLTSSARGAWARWLERREGKTPAAEAVEKPTPPNLASSLTLGRALYRSLRCAGCHGGDDDSPATPLDTLGLRSTAAELATSLASHAARSGFVLSLDEESTLSVVARLRSIEASDAATSLQHRASVPGSSAAEGRVLVSALGCAACHEVGAPRADDGLLHIDLVPIVATRTPDWIAYYLADPHRANAAATMPSLRLSPREAASIAQHLVPTSPPHSDAPGSGVEVACPVNGKPVNMTREACGEAIITASKCAACHTSKRDGVLSAPSLARYGDEHDGAATSTTLASHRGYHFDADATRALAVYLASRRGTRVREDLRVPAKKGVVIYTALGCRGCHGQGDEVAGLSLFGEGLRVRPQWLFEFLRAPDRHPVRPALHPEWAYRDLIPAERATRRMPTFTLAEGELTSLVRFFAERDGATFPYSSGREPVLVGDALTSAIADVTHKDRGGCMACHTVGVPDVARAREDGEKLAPPLAFAHDRLRPEWIEACLVEPEDWVTRMPAFARPLPEIDRVRDLVLLLRERTVLPGGGSEGLVPPLGLGDLPSSTY